MPNGKYEPQCGNCTALLPTEPSRRKCSKHQFVMPAFSDYVLCRDWWPAWSDERKAQFVDSLKAGYLYRMGESGGTPLEPVGRFEDIQELLLDREMSLFENPTYGWALYLAPWDCELFPLPGQAMEISLDGIPAPFSIRDAPVTTTYTFHEASGELRMEDRVETKRIILPAGGHEEALRRWVESHHDIPEARQRKARSLLDPRILYKDKVLRVMLRVVGMPARGRYEFVKSFGAL